MQATESFNLSFLIYLKCRHRCWPFPLGNPWEPLRIGIFKAPTQFTAVIPLEEYLNGEDYCPGAIFSNNNRVTLRG